MAPPRVLDALNVQMDRKLYRFIARRRSAQKSWDAIVGDILVQYGVRVDRRTLKSWFDAYAPRAPR